MDQIAAMEQTLKEAIDRGFDLVNFEEPNVDYEHLVSMHDRMVKSDPPMSEAKLGRWLGYAQGVLVAHAFLTLEDCKRINQQFAGDTVEKRPGLIETLMQNLKAWYDTQTPDGTDDRQLYDVCTQMFGEFTHHHKARGTVYRIIGQARAQCSIIPIKDGDMLTLYQGEDGIFSVRHPDEFNDGRFERIIRTDRADMYDKME